MKRSTVSMIALTLGLAAAVSACGGDSGNNGTGGASSSSATGPGGGETGGEGGAASGGSGGVATPTGGSGGTGGSAGHAPVVEEVVTFDPANFELPEGLAIVGDEARVGLAISGTVVSVPLAGGSATPFASLPTPPPNTSFMTGVGVDAAGAVYGALVSFTDDVQAGVYKAPAAGGAASLFGSHPMMVFPNGFAWTADGTLFVTDSNFGGVFRVATDGTTTPWIQDDALAGEPTACGGAETDLSVGANGILKKGGAFYISSSNKGILAKVPIEADGSAGPLAIVAGPDCDLGGLDGITLDDDGSIVGAVNKQNTLVRIDAAGGITKLVEGGKLDFPASVAFAGTGADRALYVTSFAYLSATQGMPAHPALLRVRFPK